jgi:thiol-disulfide isomerase/thioredoxin
MSHLRICFRSADEGIDFPMVPYYDLRKKEDKKMGTNDRCRRLQNESDLENLAKSEARLMTLWHASWCPFCRSFLPLFEKHAAEGGMCFAVVQDDEESMAPRFSVEVYPSVLFFEHGAVSKRLDGTMRVGLNEEQLTSFIKSCSAGC